jgi:glycosyltransferase involved in cell wall biosynthesis
MQTTGILENLTVLVATKDRRTNLIYCVESILGCVPCPKILVVDYGSTVPVTSYLNQTQLITIVRKWNSTEVFNKAKALNIGIVRCKTPYLCITDADQIFQKNFFSVLYSGLKECTKSFVMCKTYRLFKHPKVDPKQIHSIYDNLLSEAKAIGKPFGDGCCHASRTEYFLQSGGYHEGFVGWGFEDSDVAFRARLNKNKLININKKTSMIHLPHPKTGKYYSKETRDKNYSMYQYRRIKKV